MFNIGFTEFLILAVIVLVCVDPRKMPELARVVGRLLGEFKRATGEIKLTKLMGDGIESTIESLVEKKIEPPTPPVATPQVASTSTNVAANPTAPSAPPKREDGSKT